MDSPIIAEYYREVHPVKRGNILARALKEDGETQENLIRKELYDVRYNSHTGSRKDVPADSYLGLWMALEYNKDSGKGLFGGGRKRAAKEIRKKLAETRVEEYIAKGGLYEELIRRELAHMVRSYMTLCRTDKSYGTGLFGLMHLGEESLDNKMRADIHEVMVVLPQNLGLEQELLPVIRAAEEVYEEFFPYEGGFGSGGSV